MQALKVTAKAEDHDLPKGTKVLVLTDNSPHVTWLSLEGEAEPGGDYSVRMNSGRNVYRVPDKCPSFSIIGDGEYNIGMDCQEASEVEGNPRLEALEARVAALEAAAAQQIAAHDEQKDRVKQQDYPPPKASHPKEHTAPKKR